MVDWLEKRGCECHVATSYREAHGFLNTEAFDLVLSESSLPDGIAFRLLPWLVGSHTTLCFAVPVEDSSWWMPAIVHGRNCWGTAALRRSEFMEVLDELLLEVKSLAPAPLALQRLCLSCWSTGGRFAEISDRSAVAGASPRQGPKIDPRGVT